MIKNLPAADVAVIMDLTDVAANARRSGMSCTDYCRCVVSHLLSFAASSSNPSAFVENLVQVIGLRAKTPEFREACNYKAGDPF